MSARFLFVLILLLAAVACSGSTRPTEDDLLRREAEFAQAVAAGDTERFRSFLLEDAVFMGAWGSIARGRDAVLEEWKPILDRSALHLTWKPHEAALGAAGDMGYTYGEWRMTREGDDGSELVGTGRYVTIWRRDRDGVWRVALDVGNEDETPRAELSF